MNRIKNKYWFLTLLSILSIITFLDRNAISIAGIEITRELGFTESDFGWILAAFTISYGLFEIPTGMWGDRLGEKKILARVVVWWSLFTTLTGLAGGFVSLFVIRFMFGAGEAGAYPNTAIAVRKWFTVAERGRAQAIIWMASRIGGAITPFVIVPMQLHFGWRITFYLLGIIGVVWVVVWLLVYKSKTEPEAPKRESFSWKQIAFSKNFIMLLVVYYCYASGVFFFISWLPKYLYNGRGLSQEELTYSASLPFILAAFGCLLGGAISDYLVTKIGIAWGRRLVPLIGLGLSGLVMLGATITDNNSMAVIMLALGLAFMDVTAPVAWAIATGIGKQHSGAITGAMNTAGLLGGTVASLGIGYLITWSGDYNLPVMLIGAQLLIGATLTLGIRAES
ncbi:MAG: MFS transporter [Cyclobacteriaceae bacterium]|nr:MFS transporter [Cyclobacteriaceae bacterium]